MADNPSQSDRPVWFSAIASGDIMKIKMACNKKEFDVNQHYKVAQFAFGDTASGANIFTPLGFATFHDQSHIIELLLQAGADKEDKFEVGGVKYSPMEFAEQKSKKKALKTLQTYKVKPPRTAGAAASAAPAESAAPAKAPAAVASVARAPAVAGERTLIVFPGQGAQKVGMGKGLESIPRVKEMISKAKEILGYDVWDICINGPEAKLNSTLVSQPALYLVSLAALEKLKQEEPAREKNTVVTCGLSLGEYTALAFAGVLSFEDGLRLLVVGDEEKFGMSVLKKLNSARAEAMQVAADTNSGGMVSVLGLELTAQKVAQLCEEASKNTKEKVSLSNVLCLGNTVVAGTARACDEVVRLAPSYGATKTVKLTVAGAFHSELMRPAYEKLEKVLENSTFAPPSIPVVFNVDGKEETDPKKIKQKLLEQLVKPVLWETSILHCLDNFQLVHAVEVGPNNVLTGIFRRILKEYKGTHKPSPKAMNV